MVSNKKCIGVVLKNIRKSADLTMRQLAMSMEVSHTFISQVEHGRTPINRHRQVQWVYACKASIDDYNKVIGFKAHLFNFRDEGVAILNKLDGEQLETAFKVLLAISGYRESENQPTEQSA